MSKTRASCFITVPDTSKHMKALDLRPLAFICFSVSGTRDEAIALVFDILHQQPAFRAYIPRRPPVGLQFELFWTIHSPRRFFTKFELELAYHSPLSFSPWFSKM